MRDFTSEGKIVIYKSLAISEIAHLALIKTVPMFTVELYLARKKTKIKESTLCNSYENSGLKDVDRFYKIISLQCSWLRRLFDDNYQGQNTYSKRAFPKSQIKKINKKLLLNIS